MRAGDPVLIRLGDADVCPDLELGSLGQFHGPPHICQAPVERKAAHHLGVNLCFVSVETKIDGVHSRLDQLQDILLGQGGAI